MAGSRRWNAQWVAAMAHLTGNTAASGAEMKPASIERLTCLGRLHHLLTAILTPIGDAGAHQWQVGVGSPFSRSSGRPKAC